MTASSQRHTEVEHYDKSDSEEKQSWPKLHYCCFIHDQAHKWTAFLFKSSEAIYGKTRVFRCALPSTELQSPKLWANSYSRDQKATKSGQLIHHQLPHHLLKLVSRSNKNSWISRALNCFTFLHIFPSRTLESLLISLVVHVQANYLG